MTTSHNAGLADRLTNLGTETAFAVSQAAAEWAAAGHRVYPFHLGDLDLATPANIVAAMNTAINAGHTGYCPAAGIPALREALADDLGRRRHMSFSPDQIVVQPGGKPVITKFLQTVMNPGDGVLFPSPGYPIYESQIDYLGHVAESRVPQLEARGIHLTNLLEVVNNNTEVIAVWATHLENWVQLRKDFDTSRGLDDTGDVDADLVAWAALENGFVTGGTTELMTPRPGSVGAVATWESEV